MNETRDEMVSSLFYYGFSRSSPVRPEWRQALPPACRPGIALCAESAVWLIKPLVLCAVLAVLVTGARAADLGSGTDAFEVPDRAKPSPWSGAYLGLEGGASQTVTGVKARGTSRDYSRIDGAFGLFGGYNWHVSRVVLGLEGSATYLGGREKGTHPVLGAVETGAKWSVAAKARAGMPIGNFMPYLSLGLAATEHSLKANGHEETSVALGPVFGAGLEVAVKDDWRLRADYSLTGILDKTSRFGSSNVNRASGNHRLMIGLSRSF